MVLSFHEDVDAFICSVRMSVGVSTAGYHKEEYGGREASAAGRGPLGVCVGDNVLNDLRHPGPPLPIVQLSAYQS